MVLQGLHTVTDQYAGIGKALSIRLAAQGINVVLVAKPDSMLDETHDELQATFPTLQFRKASTTSCNTYTLLSQHTLHAHGPQVPADLGQPGGYLDQIAKATADINVQLVFCNAGYVLAGFVEKRCAM